MSSKKKPPFKSGGIIPEGTGAAPGSEYVGRRPYSEARKPSGLYLGMTTTNDTFMGRVFTSIDQAAEELKKAGATSVTQIHDELVVVGGDPQMIAAILKRIKI